MRHVTLGLLVVLSSCSRPKQDPRVKEVKEPVHVSVRVIAVPEEVDCDGAGDWKAQLKCRLSRAPRVGCTYVEVGADADAPLSRTAPATADDCDLLGQGQRAVVTPSPHKKADVWVDDAAERIVVRVDTSALVMFLKHGALLDQWSLDGATLAVRDGKLDWAPLPSILKAVPSHPDAFSDEDLTRLMASTTDAQRELNDGVREALKERVLTPPSPQWARFWSRLDEAGREDVRDELLLAIERGDDDAVHWAEGDEAILRARLLEALRSGLQSLEYASPVQLDAFARLAPEEAAPLACGQLEELYLSEDTYESLDTASTALALIAREKLKCPWVMPWLSRVTCKGAMRARRRGVDSNADVPLMGRADRERVLRETFLTEDERAERDLLLDVDDSIDNEDDIGAWGPMLLSAAEVQGPLPQEFLLREARRLYRVVYRLPAKPGDDPCRDTSFEVPELACQLPVTITRVTREACELVVDDAAKTLTLTGQTPAHE